jgi:hypothetical protein
MQRITRRNFLGGAAALTLGLNKIYGIYFSPGKAPSRACMALEWIPGDSLIEIVGSAMVVTSPSPSTPSAGE